MNEPDTAPNSADAFIDQQIDKVLAELTLTAEGRDFLWWLLTLTKAIGINPFASNALATAFNCGEQNVGQQILARLTHVAPEGYVNILKEKLDE